uniref:Uncharacterized protein n=1 Tax=Trichogramma kaykai TaxID=54128 RepID=A0ABD2WNB4_9HYME
MGNTSLNLAMDDAHAELIELLLKNGTDPNSTNANGLASLHMICRRKHYDSSLELFFKINEEKNQLIQVDAQDNLGRTPLQWDLARFLSENLDMLLDRSADLSSFVFPIARDFDEELKDTFNSNNFKLSLASGALMTIEWLEKRGFELDRNDILTIMTLFAKYELFEKSVDVEKCWYRDEEFVSKAKQIMIRRWSLYELMQLQPDEAANN